MSPPTPISEPSAATGPVHRLDGLTILRFAHAYETGGGVELHLRDLNRGLSLRNTLITILLHLTREPAPGAERAESIGGSTLIKVALPATAGAPDTASLDEEGPRAWARRWLERALNFTLFSFAVNRLFVRAFLRWRRVPIRSNDALDAGPTAAELIQRHRVDLVVLHANGSADASAVIAAARKAGVPVAVVHHFANARLGNVSVRQQVAETVAVAGGSTIGLPFYVRRRFANLADAVDLDIFCPEDAAPAPVAFATPVLFAPGRLMPDKGQMDALQVAVELHRRGIGNTLVFAGRADDPAFVHALRERAVETGIVGSVHFAGELTLLEYRDWLRASYLLLMPTRHHEGLPRTLIESQAMMVPPIVYRIGGTPDGVRHGATGFLVPLGDVAAMTAHAATLLGDPSLRQRMAASGRAFVADRFSLDAFLSRHESFYLNALSRRPRR